MRECGDCTACCYTGAVPEIAKPAHAFCPHESKGCALYGKAERPECCSSFQCAWLRGVGPDDARPDRSGVMLSLNELNGGTWNFAIELSAGAVLGTGRGMVEAAVRLSGLPCIIVDADARPPNDRGDRVAITDEMAPRALRMTGAWQEQLAPGINVHELVVG